MQRPCFVRARTSLLLLLVVDASALDQLAQLPSSGAPTQPPGTAPMQPPSKVLVQPPSKDTHRATRASPGAVQITTERRLAEGYVSYTKKTVGTCGAAHAIASKEECDAAAVSLNHVDKTAYEMSMSSWHKGCFAYAANELYFNTHPNAAKECSTEHPCICRLPKARPEGSCRGPHDTCSRS